MNELNVTPERINRLADSISLKINKSLENIDSINRQVRLLAFNAQIQASRAGTSGGAFGVVASAMGDLASKTANVADELASKVRGDIDELTIISKQLAFDVRGKRLSDLALNNIDLIDRNLYERSCDVRWWATDPSLVEACSSPDDSNQAAFASKRMGVILSAYTVYLDLALCNVEGRVIANGRAQEFLSVGKDVHGTEWFRSAMETHSSDQFGFQAVHECPLVNGKRILAYSCAVRENGRIIGVLGILFNWDALAQTIVCNTPLPPEEKNITRVCVADKRGLVFADTDGKILKETFDFGELDTIRRNTKGCAPKTVNGETFLVAHALSPGFETYATGWYSIIFQKVLSGGISF